MNEQGFVISKITSKHFGIDDVARIIEYVPENNRFVFQFRTGKKVAFNGSEKALKENFRIYRNEKDVDEHFIKVLEQLEKNKT